MGVQLWAGKMDQEVKALAAKADDLSSVPSAYTGKGELTPASCPVTSVALMTAHV